MKAMCMGKGALLISGLLVVIFRTQGQPIDLLKRYPTRLTAGDLGADRARPWQFTSRDIFHVSHFRMEAGKPLRVEMGAADLGIGHCADGAVWALLIPRDGGKLTSQATNQEETIAHVWLRFHPKEISRLLPPETVAGEGASNLLARMQFIANSKFDASYHAGPNAMIPEAGDATVDIDTVNGPRRFFVVEAKTGSAKYVAAFEQRSVKEPPAITSALAEATFDRIWQEFDRGYAMFKLRPEVDWSELRDRCRPLALRSKSAYELAATCADMLKELRDLHVWLKLAGEDVPVFNRTRTANSNPSAHAAILGKLNRLGRVQWAVTADKIGFIAIYGWQNLDMAKQCDEALEQLKDTRGLIVDVRLNGGGAEPAAAKFAGRFLPQDFVYAYNQYRNGRSHTSLTEKTPRTISPQGPWRYARPVVLLIGQKCMSSNESFVGMMTGDPEVTTMGDHTCGSSGNPKMVSLPLDMSVSVPQWIDYLPDGTPLDERGFQPQVRFDPGPGAFEGDRDDLLTAALERLRKLPPVDTK